MSPQPLRSQDAKVEGRDESQGTETNPYVRFRALATRILQVPAEDVREAERVWAESRAAGNARNKPLRPLTESTKKPR